MQKSYKLLIFSFFLLNLLWWITSVEEKYGIPQILKYILSISILGVIIYFRIKNPSKPLPGPFFSTLLIIFILWSIVLLFIGITGFNESILFKLALADQYFFIPYFLPLILLYTKFDLDFFSNLFYYSFLFIIPANIIGIIIVFFSGLSQETWYE